MDESSKIFFEKFRITECYKKDESSAVYLADHIFLDKKVILKVLNTENISDSSRIERFKREAKILAKLNHPNIIEVIDFGLANSSFYISFEYFESKTLRTLINDPEISAGQKEDLLIQLLNGLNYAHQNNIIHRDIKPENILVNESFELKLSDFGLALVESDNLVTNQYSIVGTPSYMSPEQINGKPLDIKSDLFSVGIIIYELFTGLNPFIGNNINETINKIISFDEELLLKQLKDIPENIKTLIEKLLKKQTNKRLGSGTEALELLKTSQDISTTRITKNFNTKSRLRYILATAAVIIVASLIFILTNENETVPESTSQLTEQTEADISGQIPVEKAIEDTTVDKEDEIGTIEEIPGIIPANSVKDESKTLKAEEPEINSFGNLYVECYPWAHVYINDRIIETTPLKDNILLTKGEYELKLVHPGYPEFTRRIRILENELNTIKINLDTLMGYLDCKIFPWAEIYLNGDKKGQSPLEKLVKILPGSYQLELKNPNYESIIDEILISANDTLSLKYRFGSAYK